MLLLWLVVVYLTTLEIQGFDIGRKLWKDNTKSNGAETKLSDLVSNMGGRNLPSLRDEFSDLDDSVESFLTKDTPAFAERGLPLFNDELQDQDVASEPYQAKNTSEITERKLALLEDENEDPDDAVEAFLNKDISKPVERDLPLLDDEFDAFKLYRTEDILDPVERGLPFLNNEQEGKEDQDVAVSDLTVDDPNVDKRNSMTILDMLTDIANRLDDIQDQVNELKEGKKLDNCPDGWYEYGKSCYYFSNVRASWFEALAYCQSFHGYLAEINDYYENAYLYRKVQSSNGVSWLGGTDSIKENHWMWAHSHTPMTTSVFQKWKKGEPNDLRSNEHCMDLRDGGWNDSECNVSQEFICERDLK